MFLHIYGSLIRDDFVVVRSGILQTFYSVSCGQNDQTSLFQPALVVPFRGNVDLPVEHGMLHRIALFETIQNLKRKRTPESILKKLGQTKV